MRRTSLFALLLTAAFMCTGCGSVEQVGQMSTEPGSPASAEVSATDADETNGESSQAEEITDNNEETAEETTEETTEAPSTPPEITYAPPPPVYDIEGLTYIDGTLIVNKTYSLPSTFGDGLEDICYSQFLALSDAAAAEGLDIYLSSGFRSWDYQNEIYNNYVSIYGQEATDTFSARPGNSEHQSGLAIDVNTIDDSFAGTPEALWLADHAHEFGFIIRYPLGKEDITGYKYEPWHIRYVGTDLACAVYDSGLTLEEYFGIDSKYSS